MKIAIHTADLDHERIDGTRVYILNVLKYLGKMASEEEFILYHQSYFNPSLTPSRFANYKIKKLFSPFFWTQTIFAWRLWRDAVDVVWMPMHNLPLLHDKKLKTIVTIHDLAFKLFPQYFTKKDLRKLNFLATLAITKSDRIIAVSNSTKKDILKFYPEIKAEKISVIYHGFDADLFQKDISQTESDKVLSKFKIQNSKFMLYVGALQPRKNLLVLLKAFAKIKKDFSELKLVLVGEKAWMWEQILEEIEKSPYKEDIVLTGVVPFAQLPVLYKNANLFVFPSLYEGFGIPILEAFAAGTPVVCADNSSLSEVAGDAAEYFQAENEIQLTEKIHKILTDSQLQKKMIAKGQKRVKEFSWEKCAKETLDKLHKW